MIISHKHKFIFIKCRKTAGSSVEISLSQLCGPEDIITPLTAKDDEKRLELGIRGAQNYLLPKSEMPLKSKWSVLKKPKSIKKFYNHISAKEVSALIPDTVILLEIY